MCIHVNKSQIGRGTGNWSPYMDLDKPLLHELTFGIELGSCAIFLHGIRVRLIPSICPLMLRPHLEVFTPQLRFERAGILRSTTLVERLEIDLHYMDLDNLSS